MKTVIGHDENKTRFARALERNRLPSTFLFVGPEGIGKQTFAKELAKCLLCETTADEVLDACGSCESCQLMENGNHPDFEYVCRIEGHNLLQIHQFIGDRQHRNREGLCYNFSLKPNRGKRKVAVIDDADYFNAECANSLLKILEEPPSESVMILIGTSVEKMLPTIRSRSQIFHFDRLLDNEVSQVLNRLDVSDIPLSENELVELCEGTLGRLGLFRTEGLFEFQTQLYQALSSLEPLSNAFHKELSGFIEQAGKDTAKKRVRFGQVVDLSIEFYIEVARQLCDFNSHNSRSENNAIKKTVSRWRAGSEAATDCIERCIDARSQIFSNANQATLIETWLSDLGKLSRGDEIYTNIKIR